MEFRRIKMNGGIMAGREGRGLRRKEEEGSWDGRIEAEFDSENGNG